MKSLIEEKTIDILNRSTEIIRQLPHSSKWIDEINALKMQVHEPCMLAVGGRVKAGKSTFINALLGDNFAQVGETETTATINFFSYGKPQNPSKPIKVVYKNGNEDYVDKAFMDNLQGHDARTAERRKAILYFEWQIENDILKDITLIDTPGTGAVVDDHQDAAENIFGISKAENQQLRKEHDQQTRELTKKADAVIYLVGAVANSDNQTFLKEFQEASEGASALNAIGIMSRIDEKESILYDSQTQAYHVANSLREQLSSVLPVSACLYTHVKRYAHLFDSWQKSLKTIPEAAFKKYLTGSADGWSGKYDSALLKQYPNLLPSEQRKQMKGNIPWGVFRAIINSLYESSSATESEVYLLRLANFDEVKRVLQEQFFSRAQAIRCTVILNKLSKMLLSIRLNELYSIKYSAKKSVEWLQAINQYIKPKEAGLAEDMAAYLKSNIKSVSDISRIEESINNDLVKPLEHLINEMQEQNMDYKMLKEVQAQKANFKQELYDELCELFGLYGKKPNKTNQEKMERQMFWRGKSLRYIDPKMQEIAAYAAQSYGRL